MFDPNIKTQAIANPIFIHVTAVRSYPLDQDLSDVYRLPDIKDQSVFWIWDALPPSKASRIELSVEL
ncbi:hypothetical protein BDZ94DRAFT_1278533 [Collybia nuda]|uniref:Uncharacterized protein n=1 Tax=Collybia nuda TaxID=64659 RepID=A0A9P5XTP4_9AGAR|nr:hypothetical protein BDZ94DRAFT_1278533 [Collybia nuda]